MIKFSIFSQYRDDEVLSTESGTVRLDFISNLVQQPVRAIRSTSRITHTTLICVDQVRINFDADQKNLIEYPTEFDPMSIRPPSTTFQPLPIPHPLPGSRGVPMGIGPNPVRWGVSIVGPALGFVYTDFKADVKLRARILKQIRRQKPLIGQNLVRCPSERPCSHNVQPPFLGIIDLSIYQNF